MKGTEEPEDEYQNPFMHAQTTEVTLEIDYQDKKNCLQLGILFLTKTKRPTLRRGVFGLFSKKELRNARQR
ncbi:hypothetical protein [Rufibacter roseus]|uniref:Uncharacterized protein n=1 Tax=Rufibacter roseus TaxID=1567108 RepID=A0ABW2DER0_9BACT|nr:hypothetical protein [Rufibacter roseus]